MLRDFREGRFPIGRLTKVYAANDLPKETEDMKSGLVRSFHMRLFFG